MPLSDTSSTREPCEFETDSGSDFHPPYDAESSTTRESFTEDGLVEPGSSRGKKQRKNIFQSFYNLSDFNLQTAYINIQVNVVNKGRHTAAQNYNKRSKTQIDTLPKDSDMVTIYKSFFKKALQVSDGRLTRALIHKSIGGELITPPLDKRGKHPPKNKTRKTDIQNIKDFINKFAKYTSHYSRNKNPNREYLSPDLNISKLYDLYVQGEEPEVKVSKFIFSKIFNEDFNLHFRYPLTDTCKRCDAYNMKIKSCVGVDKSRMEREKELHLRKVEAARSGMKEDAAKNKDTTTVITFDLMKTLATPSISTGVAYYKRQLWTYCFGIHNLTTGHIHMHVWHPQSNDRTDTHVCMA
ncbi:unnamed protein product [Diabrotica balteata]|uniref:Uncharacterized protein n=1 Tax=Diabrotica balteata TaxID=107213 RepID=A0A9N9T8Y3_DIABA|nr:unnamed protein product [Diabrotica balteata]